MMARFFDNDEDERLLREQLTYAEIERLAAAMARLEVSERELQAQVWQAQQPQKSTNWLAWIAGFLIGWRMWR